MFFVIFKGSLGKEVFLIDIEGFQAINDSFEQGKDYHFLSYDPNDTDDAHYVSRKHGTIYGFEVRSEKVEEEKKEEEDE
jgi:hypothetical protein